MTFAQGMQKIMSIGKGLKEVEEHLGKVRAALLTQEVFSKDNNIVEEELK